MVLLVSAPNPTQARFARFVEPELDLLLRVARSLTRNPTDAEDLVQDTLVRAYRNIDRFDGRYPRAWLLTILRNTNINRARKKRPDLLDDPEATFERSLDFVSDERPEDEFVDQVFDATIAVALDELSDDFRAVIELVDLHQSSYAEAAEALGIPVGTVMSRLHRARRRMRQRITETGLDALREDA